ncbi:hypothetical protein FRB93_013512 [Tulasnella sp. JGI-2019a]|nr:hypothetical protein FRB93_013512 [Tulasnella sp. JGI-2019a]
MESAGATVNTGSGGTNVPVLERLFTKVALENFYPLFELLSPLVCIDGTWEFMSDLSVSDWNRFGRYAARIHSMKFTPRLPHQSQAGSVASPQMLDEFTRHCPTPGLMFPNLTEVIWTAATTMELPPILLFLVPTVKSQSTHLWRINEQRMY